MKLTVIFQFGCRPYIEKIARDFLKESLGEFDYEFIDLNCSNLTIGAGFNKLVEQVKTPYVLYTMDDFAFFPNGNWVEKAIGILEKKEDINIIALRKEKDNESPWMIDCREIVDDISYYRIMRWGNRCFHFSPFLMRTEDLRKIVPLDETDIHGNIAEASGIEKAQKLNFKEAKLDIPYLGVCFHLGWMRSRVLGWKDRL